MYDMINIIIMVTDTYIREKICIVDPAGGPKKSNIFYVKERGTNCNGGGENTIASTDDIF